MAFANHDYVGTGIRRNDLRHGTKKLVRTSVCFGYCGSWILPGSCFLRVELVSQRIPHANARLVPRGHSRIGCVWRSCVRNPLGMDGIGGLAGWKWLFLLEGVPTVLLGIVFPWVLANRPEEARWLTAEEQRVVVERIQSEKREREMRHLLPALKDARVLLLAGIFFGFTVGSYGIGIWLPQIVKGQQLSNMTVGFITAGCYALACIGMVAWAAYVDRKGTRIRNLLLTFVASAAGLVLAIFFQNFWLSLAWMTVGLVGINAARSVFWVIPTQFLTGIASAGGLAFINAVGTAGGFFGPFIMGWLKDLTGSFNAGLVAMAGFLILAAALTGALKLFVREE
jgi:ACS family tartrate transporter-like MFS transporter